MENEKQDPTTHRKATSIKVLNLPRHAYHSLKRNNINTIEQLVDLGEEEVAKFRHIGPTKIDIIFDALAKFLSLPRGDLRYLKSVSNEGTPDPKKDNLTQFKKVLEFPQIATIQDDELKEQLNIATRLLDIDSVDSGLFQLGKIFENEFRTFLNTARAKGGFAIKKKDTNRLVDMINCVSRNKFMNETQTQRLTLLREQRNERALW